MMRPVNFVSASLIASVLATAIALPSWAGDLFRSSNPRPIGAETQKSFELLFKEGNFPAAVKQIDLALKSEADEPLIQALRASVAFIREDYLDMKVYGDKTRAQAQKLLSTDKLRGHIYLAASNLIEAGYVVKTQGLTSAPTALPLVQAALDEIKTAQDMDPQDPELNLVKGYMDMLIASVLPLSDLENALTSLKQYAAPDYVKWRGIALAYRDARKTDLALEAVNQALVAAPNNPELYYLKGQILWLKGGNSRDDARQNYIKALSKAKQLPPPLVGVISTECRNLTNEITGRSDSCPMQN
ncbi:Sll0314/Alr1548 family TPR repeat-containing protein [Tumidithrix elongata RA019]|uniref:Sll0314/Alr1548 family TPR repeat-containing protein n=1 Tax=Tumidithrix elongata BACA0141 TaxID=2716417 RepID=A0AAW9PSR2_9CYAN|nr:Sll0314/Alr1548 family TPR repeat-containing protein [Tumidithrix elongata RA019]